MQISWEWLKQYINLEINPEELAKLLTFAGVEVEAKHQFGFLPDTIITAKIIEHKLMDGSDHLQICQVDTGAEVLQVVCGAPNCISGMVSVLALPGTKLNDIHIKQTHIRGYESLGMLCSEKELGISDNHSGIMSLPPDTPIGMRLTEFLNLPDTIFELEITPNRPDLLGYLGIATELAALSGLTVLRPSIENVLSLESTKEKIEDYLSLQNMEPELCPRYTARVFRNVKVTDSPIWLQQRLLRSGLRPINNIVDITNYIMLETGHPLHAFDYDKLLKIGNLPIIKIRRAKDKEEFPALDGKTYLLEADDLVIADAERAIAIAGVIGGTNSHITNETTNIVLEAANFNHSSVRRTAYRHKINTDSGYRFERHLADQTAEYASCRAAQLILELAGGILCAGMLDAWPKPLANRRISLRPERFRQVIGIELSRKEIICYLTSLGLICQNPESLDTPLNFIIPPQRIDLEREIDLIEELIRLHGMDKVPQKIKPALIMDRHAYRIKREATDYLIACGFQEVVNLSFTDPSLIKKLCLPDIDPRNKQIELLNPQNSTLSVMRSSLIPQLLQNALYNLNRQEYQLRLFELNKVFLENHSLPKFEPIRLAILWSGKTNELHWKEKPENCTLFHLKGVISGLMDKIGINEYFFATSDCTYLLPEEALALYCKGEKIGELGKLKPSIALDFDIDTLELKQDIWIADIDLESLIKYSRDIHPIYKPIPRFPSMERDISFLISINVPYEKIMQTFNSFNQLSISKISIIDEYRGKQVPANMKSLTFRIQFNNQEKTLTDDEVDKAIDQIKNCFVSQWGVQLR